MASDSQSQWVPAKTFTRAGIVVNVNQLEIRGGMKRYSYSLSFQRVNDTTGEKWSTPHFAAFSQYDANSNSVVLTRKAEDFGLLMKEVEDWMQNELTRQREQWLEARIERDLERAKRDENPGFQGNPNADPSTRRIGKTARDKNKGKSAETESLAPTRKQETPH